MWVFCGISFTHFHINIKNFCELLSIECHENTKDTIFYNDPDLEQSTKTSRWLAK